MERSRDGAKLFMSITFADFSLAAPLAQALADMEFSTPTPVQAEAIPPALEGRDLMVSSQTGSGKTFAFLLPTLTPLANTEQAPMSVRAKAMPAPEVLILCPTRELAQQVSQDAINLVRHVRGVRIANVMGGMPFGKQIAQLKGAQVLVATPGRLLDLVNRRQLTLSQVRALVLDEADRMLDLGFSEDLEEIARLSASRQQTLMFSATFADRIVSLAEKMMNNPVRVAIETGQATNADIDQTLHWTDGFEHKKKLLSHWLNDETMDQAVVFASTQEDTDMLAEELAEAGHQVVALHGAMPQSVRMRRIRSLREGKAKVLVATDVAARGLDVPTISHVINFGLPMKNEDYVHRIGRTGRAGRSGRAITLATHRERGKIRSLEAYLEKRLPVTEIEGLEPSPPPENAARKGRGGPRGGSGFGGGRRFEGERNFRSEGRSFGGGERRPARDGERSFNRDGGQRDFGKRDFPRDAVGEANGNRDFAPRGERKFESRPPRQFDDRQPRDTRFEGDRPARRFEGDRPARNFGDRPPRTFNDAPRSFERDGNREGRSFNGDRPRFDRKTPGYGQQERSFGDRPRFERDGNRDGAQRDGNREDNWGNRSDRPARSFGERSDRGPRGGFGGERSGDRGGEGRRFDRPRREGGFAAEGGERRPRRFDREDRKFDA